eukprot:3500980-Prymnesium_polylepis.1
MERLAGARSGGAGRRRAIRLRDCRGDARKAGPAAALRHVPGCLALAPVREQISKVRARAAATKGAPYRIHLQRLQKGRTDDVPPPPLCSAHRTPVAARLRDC